MLRRSDLLPLTRGSALSAACRVSLAQSVDCPVTSQNNWFATTMLLADLQVDRDLGMASNPIAAVVDRYVRGVSAGDDIEVLAGLYVAHWLHLRKNMRGGQKTMPLPGEERPKAPPAPPMKSK